MGEKLVKNFTTMNTLTKITVILIAAMTLFSCKNTKTAAETEPCKAAIPTFSADSAYIYCQQQCLFGPRAMNTAEHDRCRDWIAAEFRRHGCEVTLQECMLKAFDGTMLRSTNIIASYTPKNFSEEMPRIMLCAHYDTRPWADNDPEEKNHHSPILGANDGASGIAVMLEIARILNAADSAKTAVEFVCFDAEDYGTPSWYKGEEKLENPWALGSKYWAERYIADEKRKEISYGILLDMVGGIGAKFYHEGMSLVHAKSIVQKVWSAASEAGYSTFFPSRSGGYVTDDHIAVNEIAQIPCVDIIAHYPDCEQSSFGMTWHTVNDNMENISKETLEAVGQTLTYLIYK